MIKTLVKKQLIKEIVVADALIKIVEKKIKETGIEKQESTIWV